MNTITASTPICCCNCIHTHHHVHPPPHFFSPPIHPQFRGLVLNRRRRKGIVESSSGNGAVFRSNQVHSSPWDDKPFEILPNGKRSYLDEQDVIAFLDPPNDLIPLDPTSYNPAAYLWKKIEDIPEERRHRLLLLIKPRSFPHSRKKIEDIPEERRHRLLLLIKPRLISMAWQIAGTRYEDPTLVRKTESMLLINSNKDEAMLEYYNCRTSG
ncbi:hypothetical protein L195_g022048, partial [Trifolium pratense]